MSKYIKLFLVSVFFPFLLYSSTFNIKDLQDSFYIEVIIKPLYLKRYKVDLDSVCVNDTRECRLLEISKFFDDAEIQKALKKRDEKFTFNKDYWKIAKKQLSKNLSNLSSSQYITLVDLSHQILSVVLWDNDKKKFYPIGFDFISSGNIDREADVKTGEDHYLKTPAGLFSIQSGWRSIGKTFDDNTTMPYGEKDRFVFYFGIQKSIRYNTFDINGTKIKDQNKWKVISDDVSFAIHAHNSIYPLGEPNSHGCIRMSNELNTFLDNNLVFFKRFYNEKNEWIHASTFPPHEPSGYNLAGEFILILDKM